MAGAGSPVRSANGFCRRSVGGKRGREAIPCQDRSRRRRWPKASLYKGLPPDQTRPPRATFEGISPRPRSGDNAPGMQAWRGDDRQQTVNFKPLIFSEIHAAGDRIRQDCAGDRVRASVMTERKSSSSCSRTQARKAAPSDVAALRGTIGGARADSAFVSSRYPASPAPALTRNPGRAPLWQVARIERRNG